MIVNEDILKWCEEYTGEPFHAVLCDPPYELGFMGKSWDSTGIAFDKNTWAAISRHLYPGAYLLAFGGTRTFHRIAVAIEDAGFEIRDTVMWVYGSGFPKSHNVGKAVDKQNGTIREVIGTDRGHTGERVKNHEGLHDDDNYEWTGDFSVTKGTSPWEGYGTALKPSWEPIIIARKPLEGTVAQNALKYGSGALNIDGSRVGTDGEKFSVPQSDPAKREGEVGTDLGITRSSVEDFQAAQRASIERTQTLGRWPANLIHDGSDEVVGMFPNSKDGVAVKRNMRGKLFKPSPVPIGANKYADDAEDIGYHGSGSAARFFYGAKVSKRERDAGLEGFEEKDGGALEGNSDMENDRKIGANPERKVAPVRNNHPTLKPIALTTYLAKLILPPKLDKPRRLLVPFAGSGSEVIGGYLAGWDEVVGVEREKEYAEIAEARIKHWTKSSPQSSSSSTSVPPESTDSQEILDI